MDNIGMAFALDRLPLWMAQASLDGAVNTPEPAVVLVSGPQFFIALIAGLVLAFAFQLLLTNLSVAAGISYLGRSSSDDGDSDSHESGSLGGTVKKIGFAVGLWTLLTVSVALFLACLLAVKLSVINSAVLGAIVGVVIWGAYFVLLVLFSSMTVGSLAGSVVNTAVSGFQAIFGTATAALGAKAASSQVVSTAEAAAAAIRRELGAGLDPTSVRESIEDYLDNLRPAGLDLPKIRGEFEKLVNDPELRDIAGSGSPIEIADRLRSIDRGTFMNLVSSRTDLSRRDVERLVGQLESVWQTVVNQFQKKDPTADLVEYLKSAQPNALNSSELSAKIDRLTEEVRQQRTSAQPGQFASASAPKEEGGMVSRALQLGFTSLIGTVMERGDLSDLNVEKILGQLQTAKAKVSDTTKQIAQKVPGLSFNTVKADVENYLLNTYSWHFNRETLQTEFRDVIYDSEADPLTVQRQLEEMNRSYFVDVLAQRNDLTPARASEIADQLEVIRASTLSTVRAAATEEQSKDTRSRVENYLRSTGKAELNPQGIERDFRLLLDDREAGFDALQNRLSQFDRNTLVAILAQRPDTTPEEANRIVSQLEGTRDSVLSTARESQERVKAEALAVRGRVETYLRNTNKSELNPEGIKRDFKLLLDDPQAGGYALRDRLSQIDRDTLVQLLAQRQDITPEEADRIVTQMEDVRHTVLNAPQIVADKAKDQYDQVSTAIADYLRRTNLSELDPNGIQHDLNTLLHDPKQGTIALRQRLSQVDRETLVKLLSQRDDLTEEQVNQYIDQVQEAIRRIVRSPRRLASRTKKRVQDFQSNVESYLLQTNKDELNPDGIKRDLQLLLNDPRAGASSLGERLSQVDRSTLVALLSQRQDISTAEAERIVDQVLSVRDQVSAQIQKIQNRIQSVIDGILARIRDYLNALDRPELNYDGIKRDVRTMFYDPQAGFDAMRDRLGSFNRDTLVAVLSSRDDISEEQANHIIDQVEDARSSVLRRAERLQSDAQRRLEDVKFQAQKQVKETQKAAASAAWWLFGTALVSAGAAALAGAIAVRGV